MGPTSPIHPPPQPNPPAWPVAAVASGCGRLWWGCSGVVAMELIPQAPPGVVVLDLLCLQNGGECVWGGGEQQQAPCWPDHTHPSSQQRQQRAQGGRGGGRRTFVPGRSLVTPERRRICQAGPPVLARPRHGPFGGGGGRGGCNVHGHACLLPVRAAHTWRGPQPAVRRRCVACCVVTQCGTWCIVRRHKTMTTVQYDSRESARCTCCRTGAAPGRRS